MILLLSLVVATSSVSTSTATTYQRAAVGWEVAAEDALGALEICDARLAFEKSAADTIALEADLVVAQKNKVIADLQLDLIAKEKTLAQSVSRTRRTVTAVGAALCALGAGTAILGGVLGPSERSRQVLGVGGAFVGAGGCLTTWLAW